MTARLSGLFFKHFSSAFCHISACYFCLKSACPKSTPLPPTFPYLTMWSQLMRLSSLLLISAVAGKCRVDYVEKSPSCDTKKLGMDFYAIGALHYLTPMKIEVQQNGVINFSTSQWQFEEAFSTGIYVRAPEYINMTCSNDTQDFPNACGKLTVQVF